MGLVLWGNNIMAIYQVIDIKTPGTYPKPYKIEAKNLTHAKRIASMNQNNLNSTIIILSEIGIGLAKKKNDKWGSLTFNTDPSFV